MSLDRIVELLESVGILLHAVDTYKPVLSRVCLLQVVQFDILVAYLNVACTVKPRWGSEIQLQQCTQTINGYSHGL